LQAPGNRRYKPFPMHKPVDIIEKLRAAGLRPTRQRLALAQILFGSGDRHITAEALLSEAEAADVPVSLATVYNTLNQFEDAGILRQVAIEGGKTFFDTNTSDHLHFYISGRNALVDIDADDLKITGLPALPPGTELDRIDVIVRLKPAAL
jgi:Fur family transcriptional regulator, iron response regulator